jgi:hypothetical protein
MSECRVSNEAVTSHQPKSLFKFYDWGEAFGQKVLTNRQLWFSRPQSFNDPFDAFVTEGELFGEDIKNADYEFTSFQHSCCCFSLRWDSTLMWSHYSRSHRGYCVEFDVSGLSELFRAKGKASQQQDTIELRHVQYRTVPADPISHQEIIGNSLTDRARDFYTTKSRDWAYEEEVRAIWHQTLQIDRKDRRGALLRFDPKKCIRTVLLGRRISPKHKDEIRKCIESKGLDINIEQCRRIKGTFLLKRVGLADIDEGGAE